MKPFLEHGSFDMQHVVISDRTLDSIDDRMAELMSEPMIAKTTIAKMGQIHKLTLQYGAGGSHGSSNRGLSKRQISACKLTVREL